MRKWQLTLFLALTATVAMAGETNYVELLTNGKCDGTFNGWSKEDGGDGWAIITDTDGSKCWVSSFGLCTIWQTIMLTDKGFSVSDIDSGHVTCKASAQMKPGVENDTMGASEAMVYISMLDEDGNLLESKIVMYDLCYSENWQTYEISFDVKAGTRFLQYGADGQDAVNWAGNYGPAYKNLSLKAGISDTNLNDNLVLLTYIKSTGWQAFNTNYIHKPNTRVEMDCKVVQDHMRKWETLFGARLGDYNNNAFYFFSRSNRADAPCFCRTGDQAIGEGFVYGERIIIKASGKTATWYRHSNPDKAVGSVTTTGTTDEGKTPMMLFCLNTSNTLHDIKVDSSPSVMTLYGCKIYEGNDLVHDFVPAKKGHEVGLYDKVTGSFGASLINVPFVAGDIVSSCNGDHIWGDWQQSANPTCTENGELLRTCIICGEKETEVIPAFGHQFNDEGICIICGEEKQKPWGKNEGGYCGRKDTNGGKNVYYTITNTSDGERILTISKSPFAWGDNCDMSDYDIYYSIPQPWLEVNYYYEEDGSVSGLTMNCDFKQIVIEDGVTSIGRRAFETHDEIIVIIPASVKNIGHEAFYYNYNITDIYCLANPNNLTWSESRTYEFKRYKQTRMHVFAKDLATYKQKFADANVTFVGDLDDFIDGLTNVTTDKSIDNAWYTLDGKKLNGQPTKSGIYINGGRKVLK